MFFVFWYDSAINMRIISYLLAKKEKKGKEKGKKGKNLFLCVCMILLLIYTCSGADPGFQVRGGGALKKIAPSGGRLENVWGISCEKSRFYANKSYFFQL